ncbi:pimeloyl-ACP methyl ester carboxylesterase [Kushneria sinocarnis]|uniref:Pimeloyl-ACP methyl ester carboxylesterase n=1 Tax=Kushneria sinocarnis TaxID=595502 RepID=A0A420WTR9_9GAMM|nr:alpha/beta hydrolase [Kushneria sinocarnis]RKQ96893.1 pimeloyl-ACP methyl ester carboxylesterase [Kushneria sinocarnis]
MLPLIDEGQGEPTLLLMHFFGNSHRDWAEVMPHLTSHYRCIAVDMPGFGDAGLNEALDSVAMADQVEETVRELRLERVVLAGHSFSGRTAMLLAARRPAWLESLVLVAPAPPGPQPVSDEERRFQLAFDFSREQAEAFIRGAVVQPLSEAGFEHAVHDAMRASREGWYRWPRTTYAEDHADTVGRLNCPVRVIVGDRDPSLPPDVQQRLVMPHLEQGELRVIEQCGHLLPLEIPERLAQEMRTFIG